jgi:hypothetical protein
VIRYKILEANRVHLKVFDMPGREVMALIGQYQQPGTYTVSFNSGKLLSGGGMFYYRMTLGNESKKMKMICIN